MNRNLLKIISKTINGTKRSPVSSAMWHQSRSWNNRATSEINFSSFKKITWNMLSWKNYKSLENNSRDQSFNMMMAVKFLTFPPETLITSHFHLLEKSRKSLTKMIQAIWSTVHPWFTSPNILKGINLESQKLKTSKTANHLNNWTMSMIQIMEVSTSQLSCKKLHRINDSSFLSKLV